jgi:TatD DNase family protein
VVFTDTHCHLNLNQFDTDRDFVIRRALDAGVERMLVPGIDLESSRRAIDLAEHYPAIYAAIGIHPNTPNAWDDATLNQLKELAVHPKVVAIGEVGLDQHWKTTDVQYQQRVFQAQLKLAAEVQKPVVVHSREALDVLFPILMDWAKQLRSAGSPLSNHPGVLHAFEGDLDRAQEAARAGFYIGLAGPVTFPNAQDKHRLSEALPLNNILIETDSPFLTPHPYRGQRNEPAYVTLVALSLAERQKKDIDAIAQATTVNASHLFRWSL